MSYNSDQQRDERGRWSSNGGPSTARAERAELNRRLDARRYSNTHDFGPAAPRPLFDKVMSGLRAKFGANAPSEDQVRLMMQTGAHTAGIHDATLGKTLAETSAEGTNPAAMPPKIGGNNG
jgi:hypothetical protein